MSALCKPLDALRSEDLSAFPVWESAIDEADNED
jgi:hypothetical protein